MINLSHSKEGEVNITIRKLYQISKMLNVNPKILLP